MYGRQSDITLTLVVLPRAISVSSPAASIPTDIMSSLELENKLGFIGLNTTSDTGDTLSFLNENNLWVDLPYGLVNFANLGLTIILGTIILTGVMLFAIEIISNGHGGLITAFNRGVEVTGVDQLVSPIVEAIEGGTSSLPELNLRRQAYHANSYNANRRRRRR